MKDGDLLKIVLLVILTLVVLWVIVQWSSTSSTHNPHDHHHHVGKNRKNEDDAIVGAYHFNQTSVFPPEIPAPNSTVQGITHFKADGTVTHIHTAFLGAQIPGAPSAILGSQFTGFWTKTGNNTYRVDMTAICVFSPNQPVSVNNFSRTRLTYDLLLVPSTNGANTFNSTSCVQTEHSLASLDFSTPFFTLPFTIEARQVLLA